MLELGSLVIIREATGGGSVLVAHVKVTLCFENEAGEITHINAEGMGSTELDGVLLDDESVVVYRAMPVATTEYSSVELIKS